jgi:hypothetical protein
VNDIADSIAEAILRTITCTEDTRRANHDGH